MTSSVNGVNYKLLIFQPSIVGVLKSTRGCSGTLINSTAGFSHLGLHTIYLRQSYHNSGSVWVESSSIRLRE